MKLTTEEKKQRQQERIREARALMNKFPSARFGDFRTVSIWVAGGHSYDLEIIADESCIWEQSGSAKRFSIPLNDIGTLAEFIAALTARLNDLVEKANSDIERINAIAVKKVPDVR